MRNMSPEKGMSLEMQTVVSNRWILVAIVAVLPACLDAGTATAEDVAVKIGNPLLARFPTSGDPENARARSVWDMHYFNNRVYIGSGDYWANTGGVDVWTYNGVAFENEYAVDDEMIWDFFEFEAKLFIPGNDATESWSFENLYINDPDRDPNPGWLKLRTLPGGLHCFDVALFNGRLYASIATDGSTPNKTLVSDDMGQTWTTFLSEYCSFVVFDDFMFLTGDNKYRHDGTALVTITPVLGVSRLGMNTRRARFQDGVLYAEVTRYALQDARLYFLPASQVKSGGVATRIAKFVQDRVRDIVVRGTTCFVMTAEEVTTDTEYIGRVYSSSDLTNWSLKAEFIVPGIPLSFEIMNNKAYVGLGSRYEPTLGWVCVGPESGSIWEMPFDISFLVTADFRSSTYSVAENGGSVTVNVDLNQIPVTGNSTSVDYATSNGTATAGSDYTPASGTLNFGATDTTRSFTITINDDHSWETDETVTITLSNPVGCTLTGTNNPATLTITNDELDPDGDRISSWDEQNGTYGYVTNPALWDSDGDTWGDFQEMFNYYTNPTDINDYPTDVSSLRVPFFSR